MLKEIVEAVGIPWWFSILLVPLLAVFSALRPSKASAAVRGCEPVENHAQNGQADSPGDFLRARYQVQVKDDWVDGDEVVVGNVTLRRIDSEWYRIRDGQVGEKMIGLPEIR